MPASATSPDERPRDAAGAPGRTGAMTPALFDEGPFALPRALQHGGARLRRRRRTPGKIALEVLSAPGTVAESWTYGALIEAVRRTAGGLARHGIGRGDRLLLRLSATSDFPCSSSPPTRSAPCRSRPRRS